MKKLILTLLLLIVIAGLTNAQENTTTKTYSGIDTSATLYDTLSRKISTTTNAMPTTFSRWFQVILMPNDTIEVSTAIGFTAGITETILPGYIWTSQQYDVTAFRNFYWRRKGTGTAEIYYRFFGM